MIDFNVVNRLYYKCSSDADEKNGFILFGADEEKVSERGTKGYFSVT